MGKKNISANTMRDLLQTKIALPRVRSTTVPRAALLKTLDDGLEGKLTLISAPAGFGKTTLVSEWAAHLNQYNNRPSVAWVSLDAGDNDPMRFWHYVIAACQIFDSTLGHSALAQLSAPRQPAVDRILTTFINDLSGLSARYVLVLEDYHVIISPSIHEALTFLLDHLPETLHVVIMTRTDPALPLARLRARNELNELHASDLRFSNGETQALLEQIIPFSLPSEAIKQLETHTEGWAAGLQIAALALQGRGETAGVETFLQDFSGSHRHILDYLATEVFEAQSSQVQEFLLQTSFVSRLSADLCDAVTGRNDSAVMLELLERANLFLVPLDGSQRWYRYHALFAEAMQHYAQRRLEKAHLDELYRRAALWYEQHELFDEAVEISLMAGAFERSAILIERSFELRRFRYEIYTLRRWIEALPQDLLPQHPFIALLHAMSILFSSDRYAAATKTQMEKPLQIAEQKWLTDGNQWGLGAVLALRSMGAFWQGDMVECMVAAGQSLELLPDDETFWRSISVGNMAMGELYEGNLQTAYDTTQASLAMFRNAHNPYGERAMIFVLGEISRERGDLRQSARHYRQVLAESGDDLTDRGSALCALAALAYEWNDLETADSYAMEALDIAEKLPDEPLKIKASLVLARIQTARGAVAEARETIQSVIAVARWPLLRRELLAYQARLALMAGDMTAVQRWYATSAETSDDHTSHLHREQEALIAVRLMIQQDKIEEALRLLDQWQMDAHAQGRGQTELEIMMLKALAYFAHERLPQARKHLIEALRLSQTGGYRRMFLNEGEAIAALLKVVLPDVSEQTLITDVRALLYAFTREAAEQPTFPTEALPAPLSPQEQRVLHLLTAGMSYPQMAEELVVSINTIKTQVKSIYRKLNVENRDEASDLAHHLNLV